MNLWNTRSIAGKLTLVNLLVSATALLLAGVAFLVYDLYTYQQDLIRSLSTEAEIVGTNSISALTFDDPVAAESTLSALRNSPKIAAAVIIRSDNRRFAEYTREGSPHVQIMPRLQESQMSGHWPQNHQILLGSRILFQAKPVGTVYLLADTNDLRPRAEQYALISLCILLLCLTAAILATHTVRHVITDPLTSLAEAAQIVSRKQDYSVRAKANIHSDELSFLVESFNQMLEQIQARDRALENSKMKLEQRVLERTAELTAANKELEAFSYSVAHDLRGPLDLIGNISYLLQQSYAANASPGTQKLIDELAASSRHMATLIDDLLNLSRASSAALHRVPVDLTEAAQNIFDRLQTESPERKVHFKATPGMRTIADDGLIRVALDNLLRNAWKYSSRIPTAEIEFGFFEEKENIVYYLRDNGAGFNPRYADRLFRPFQRLHSQTEFPGTGIGLATVQRIIHRHGGRIWAEGMPDRGATFYFTIPYSGGDTDPAN